MYDFLSDGRPWNKIISNKGPWSDLCQFRGLGTTIYYSLLHLSSYNMMIRAQSPKIHHYFAHGNTISHSFECLHRHSWSPKKESCWLCWLDSYSSVIVEVFVKCFDNIVCQRIFVQILMVPRRCILVIFVMFIQSHLQVTHPVKYLFIYLTLGSNFWTDVHGLQMM